MALTLLLTQMPLVLQEYADYAAALPANAVVVTQPYLDNVSQVVGGLDAAIYMPALPQQNGIPSALSDRLSPAVHRLVIQVLVTWYFIFVESNGNAAPTPVLIALFLDALIIFAANNGTSDQDPVADVFIPDSAGGFVDVDAAPFWQLIKTTPYRRAIKPRQFFRSLAHRARQLASTSAYRWGAELGVKDIYAGVSFDFAGGLPLSSLSDAERAIIAETTARALAGAGAQRVLAHREGHAPPSAGGGFLL